MFTCPIKTVIRQQQSSPDAVDARNGTRRTGKRKGNGLEINMQQTQRKRVSGKRKGGIFYLLSSAVLIVENREIGERRRFVPYVLPGVPPSSAHIITELGMRPSMHTGGILAYVAEKQKEYFLPSITLTETERRSENCSVKTNYHLAEVALERISDLSKLAIPQVIEFFAGIATQLLGCWDTALTIPATE